MYQTIDEFMRDYSYESGATQKVMNVFTDAALSQNSVGDHRTLGRAAWHIITTYAEMAGQGGIVIKGVDKDAPVPSSAAEIQRAYAGVSDELVAFIKANWKDSDLLKEKDFYGEKWSMARMLSILIRHEVHHRGQMTVLMRLAGLKVPGVYGPAMEEWEAYGAKPPVV